jgi:NAD(P)-dependent dehydrogenase (short-subunit alcohol dehydrogenase family)
MARRISEEYRNAFVTGSGSGLGRAFADMLLGEGVPVWGTSRDLPRLGRAAEPFHPVLLDLADAAASVAAFRAAETQAGGAFDLVVNNAGYGVFGPFEGIPFAAWEAQVEAMLLTTRPLPGCGAATEVVSSTSPRWPRSFRCRT